MSLAVEAEEEKVKQGITRIVIAKKRCNAGVGLVFVSPWPCYFAMVVKRVADILGGGLPPPLPRR